MPPSPSDRSATKRSANFESLESRIVFSVDSVVADLVLQGQLDQQVTTIQTSSFNPDESTGAEYVFSDYGFDGSGQTIAVIDSGIAWDHYALGGGFGEEYRVVGGWDFAENDADPYDDASAGYHGTHVAGIIGSDDPQYRGVASGADLVGLRVFDDNGAGSLDWVEQALQWVHDNQYEFANPITTVNLSLGVNWNADEIPDWAILEDEFAQLEADNIFISVAAGNAFQNYETTGLAYPATSEFVVPVASYGSDGLLSDFSQRNDRVLVAPGESIQSTVPGYLFGSQQSTGFLAASGTSMAAPYVAGASAVLRQAMQFVGYQDIDQQLLYEHFRVTADQLYDSVTESDYYRLNLGAAIDAVMFDAIDSTIDNASDIGTLINSQSLSGTINKITDVDAISFNAGQTGQLTINVSQTYRLDAALAINGQSIVVDEGVATIDVVEGQTYVLSISTRDGVGRYELDLDIQPTINSIDLGQITDRLFENLTVNGEQWYVLTANQNGILSAAISQTDLGIEIFDSSMGLVTEAQSSSGILRVDTWVNGGQEYFIKITGSDSSFDLKLNNQVSLINGFLNISGTAGNDLISIEDRIDDGKIVINVSNTNYQFDTNQVTNVFVDGLGGYDSLIITLRGTGDEVFLVADNAYVTTNDFSLATGSFDSISVFGDSTDSVVFLDSNGDDSFTSTPMQSVMTGIGFLNTSSGITNVQAVSRNGNDTAVMIGSDLVDQFTVTEYLTQQTNSIGKVVAVGFSNVKIEGQGDGDSIIIHGSDATDRFTLQGDRTQVLLNGDLVSASGMEQSIIVANELSDSVLFLDSSDDDRLNSSEWSTIMTGQNYKNVALGFRDIVVDAMSSGDNDTAWVTDTTGDDEVSGDHNSTRITGNGYNRQFFGFDSVTVVAENGGSDQVSFVGTRGRDTMLSEGNTTWVWGASYQIGLIGFDSVNVDGNGGNDSTLLRGGNGNTEFVVARTGTQMTVAGVQVSANNFGKQRLDGQGGQNSIRLTGFDQDDLIRAEGSALIAYLDGMQVQSENFIWLEAETDDNATSTREFGAVDFWYALHGDWRDITK